MRKVRGFPVLQGFFDFCIKASGFEFVYTLLPPTQHKHKLQLHSVPLNSTLTAELLVSLVCRGPLPESVQDAFSSTAGYQERHFSCMISGTAQNLGAKQAGH